jgi:hypothetical protein
MRKLGCMLFFFFCAPAFAVPQAVVETVQMPAWLDRAGGSQPLAVGMEVKNGDRIRTGRDARATLKLAEGSTVKLGENAALVFYSLSLRPERAFKGALDVAAGAFRFTTDALAGNRSRHQLSIRIGTATAAPVANSGGTDLWGKSDAERDLILLIEGKIAVRRAGETVEMEQPLTYFAAPKNAASLPVAPVDPEQFKRWARETEVLPGDGAARRGGKWKVRLAIAGGEKEALATYDQARASGYAAKIRPRSAGEGQWAYEILLAQLPSEREASVAALKVRADIGFEAAPTR